MLLFFVAVWIVLALALALPSPDRICTTDRVGEVVHVQESHTGTSL